MDISPLFSYFGWAERAPVEPLSRFEPITQPNIPKITFLNAVARHESNVQDDIGEIFEDALEEIIEEITEEEIRFR